MTIQLINRHHVRKCLRQACPSCSFIDSEQQMAIIWNTVLNLPYQLAEMTVPPCWPPPCARARDDEFTRNDDERDPAGKRSELDQCQEGRHDQDFVGKADP